MYNKISSLILNSGKANGLSDVYIAQPDSLKESLAGKIFIIAEIGCKKPEGKRVFDFLISSLDDYYYNDEKIMLRDKIEGLKIENIFEAAIAKTNKSLNEFLLTEKIRLNAAATNITIGVIYENKLYFSSFGRNRSLLIYRHLESYEIINVEASAADSEPQVDSEGHQGSKEPALFSSVISGEIPPASYFLFTSEALPEYISGKDLMAVITKLPPIVAAEQIKNILSKINTFVPFLAVIIKNTIGADNQESREEPEENLSAHSSISSLNYTEQKTEQMLAPAGLISVSKIYRGIRSLTKNFQPKTVTNPKKIYRAQDDDSRVNPPIDLGKVKSLNLARADSFLTKQEIFFKKRPNYFSGLKNITLSLPSLFSPHLYSGLKAKFSQWLKSLSSRNRTLFIVLLAVVVILVGSLWLTNYNQRREAAKNNLNNLIATIEEKQSEIDAYLLYNNEKGATTILSEALVLLDYLPRQKKSELTIYNNLKTQLDERADKIQKIVKIDNLEKTNDLTGLGVNNLIFADNKLYAASSQTIFSFTPLATDSARFDIAGAKNLISPQFDRKNLIYYWNDGGLIKFDLKNNQATAINIAPEAGVNEATNYKIFAGNLYLLAKNQNQIYKSNLSGNSYLTKTDWLKDQLDLNLASDLYVDGNIYVLKNTGEIIKLYKGTQAEFAAPALSPIMTSANKITVGTKYIYVFEAASKRLAVLALKDGHLMNQYQLNLIPRDFAIDEDSQTAYFLVDEIVYRLSLNK